MNLSNRPAALRVLCSNGAQSVFTQLTEQFESANGCAVSVSYDSGKGGLARIMKGDTADLYIFNAATIDELAAQNRIAEGGRRDLARGGVGVAVLAGAPRPDISSVEAFRRTLLDARSIAYTEAGMSGIHFSAVIERLGIAAQVRAKARTQPDGLVGGRVVNGEAELAIQFMSELVAVRGIEVVGPFPPELQMVITLAIGVGAVSEQPQLSRKMLEFMTSAAAGRAFAAGGYEMCAPRPA